MTLTAQQPENNIVRVALQGFAAVCGGTQSLHTNGFDEALALPSERAAKIALRTQQVIAHESGATDTVDPFAGSYYVEALTDEIEARASELIAKVDELGGSVNAIEFITGEIDESAWGYQERYRIEQDVVVGVNRYVDEKDVEVPDLLRVDPESERAQLERLKAFKADRDQELVQRRLEELREVARGTDNLLPRDQAGAARPRLDGRGLRRDAGRLRRLRPDLLDARVRRRPGAHRDRHRPRRRGRRARGPDRRGTAVAGWARWSAWPPPSGSSGAARTASARRASAKALDPPFAVRRRSRPCAAGHRGERRARVGRRRGGPWPHGPCRVAPPATASSTLRTAEREARRARRRR